MRTGQITCYNCGKVGHTRRESTVTTVVRLVIGVLTVQRIQTLVQQGGTTPGDRGGARTQARVYALTDQPMEEQPNTVMETGGMISDLEVLILFDPGASHSFIEKSSS